MQIFFNLNIQNQATLTHHLAGYDIVLPLIHGQFGEDGQLQKILEEAEISFIGSNSAASILCFDKATYKAKLLQSGIQVPAGFLISSGKDIAKLKPLTFIKPTQSGSSIRTYKLMDISESSLSHVQALLDDFGPLLAEEFIVGMEITVGIFGNQPLPVIEIIPPEQGGFDYENKYNGNTQELIPPINVSKDLQQRTQELALRVHHLCGCKHVSRTDMLIQNHDILVLETNTMPGMTAESLYP